MYLVELTLATIAMPAMNEKNSEKHGLYSGFF